MVDPLRLANQPRVIAEVIGGILLGPSVMMRIPGFKEYGFIQPLAPLSAPLMPDLTMPTVTSFPRSRCRFSTTLLTWVLLSSSSWLRWRSVALKT